MLSADQINQPDVISIMGASSALLAAGIPFEGPLAGVRICRDEEGEFIVNPSFDEAEDSDLDLVVAGSKDAVFMLEAGAQEVSEEDMLAALMFAQEAIAAFCDVQERFLAKVEIKPMDVALQVVAPEIVERVFAAGADKMKVALHNPDKHARMDAVAAVKDELLATHSDEELAAHGKDIKAALKLLEKKTMRTMVLEEGERADGRKADEIRRSRASPATCRAATAPGLFTRGQTQVLSVLTLGMLSEWQRIDTIDVSEGKRYIHHYNFPPFSTGETGFMRGPKRRDIGHGALAERALLPVIPAEEDFPYTIRIVTEVLECNGSSSMGSVCGSSLALMDAGVPIAAPVSGIAMGLIKEGDSVAVLSDIQGLEDFLGDMDFKVAGTPKGITAMQMDNKAKGLSHDILEKALMQAKEGRAFILAKMLEAIEIPREALSEFAPRILTIKIPTDKIRDVIGSRRQDRPRHPGRDRRADRHQRGRHDLHREPRPGWGRGDAPHQGDREGARDRRGLREGARRVDPDVRRVRRAQPRQGRPAAHLARGRRPRGQGRRRAERGRRGRRGHPRRRRARQGLARPPQQAEGARGQRDVRRSQRRRRPRSRPRSAPRRPQAEAAALGATHRTRVRAQRRCDDETNARPPEFRGPRLRLARGREPATERRMRRPPAWRCP